jgi:hypothetical protein
VAQEYAPRILVFSGLEGIGRRAYLGRVCQDVLDLPRGPQILLTEHAGLEDVFLRLTDELAEVASRDDLARNLRLFQGLEPAQQAAEVANSLGELAEGRDIPVLVDSGSLMERDSGQFRPEWLSVFELFLDRYPDQYLAVVQRRVPAVRDLEWGAKVLVQRVPPLGELDAKILLGQLLRRAGLAYSASDVDQLAEFIGGYPPSAYFAAAQASAYGLATLRADRSALVDFRARRFTRFLDELGLDEQEWLLLRYLAGEAAVPLAALAVAADEDEATVAQRIRRLIDLSLVVVAGAEYSVSPPISDAVVRARGLLDPGWYVDLLPRLHATFWQDPAAAPTVPLIDLTLRALLRSGTNSSQYDDVLRVSTIHDIASESYHRGDWDDAVGFASRAEGIYRDRNERRRLFEVQETLVKALTQLERYSEAETVLADLERAGARRYWYQTAQNERGR